MITHRITKPISMTLTCKQVLKTFGSKLPCCTECHKPTKVMFFEHLNGSEAYVCCSVLALFKSRKGVNRTFRPAKLKPSPPVPLTPRVRKPQDVIERLFRLKLRAQGSEAQQRAANALAMALGIGPIRFWSEGVSG